MQRVIISPRWRGRAGVPVLPRRSRGRHYSRPRRSYFLVDPLDGTKEFIRGGDDYTVNIGLLAGGVPRLGVVFAPARAALHGGLVGHGAWLEQGGARTSIATRQPGAELTAVASKSHFNQATADY